MALSKEDIVEGLDALPIMDIVEIVKTLEDNKEKIIEKVKSKV